MNKTDKTRSLNELKDSFSKAKASFFADYKGLTSNQMNDLRKKLRANNVEVAVAKNNLARIAVKEAKLGEKCEKMMDTVAGPTLIAFAYGDEAAAAKTIVKFAEDNEVFNLKESILGTQTMGADQIKELAKLPSREVLLAKMLGSLNAPASNFVGVLAAIPRSLLNVLTAIEQKKKEV